MATRLTPNTSVGVSCISPLTEMCTDFPAKGESK